MSATLGAAKLTPQSGSLVRPTAVGLLAAMVLLVLGGNLAGNGAIARPMDVDAILLQWEQGSLLQVLVQWIAGWFVPVIEQQTTLALIYIAAAASGAAIVFRQMRDSDWPLFKAILALGIVLCHPMLLHAITMAGPEFLIVCAAATLIPGRRRLEAVGDAQSVINYGLILPLLLLSGPALAALIPVLLLAVPLSDPEARRKSNAFMAMLLVGLVPVLIIVLGVTVLAARAGMGPGDLLAPMLRAFAWQAKPMELSILLMAISAPVWIAVALHVAIPDRRRKIFTSVLVLAVPLYLAIGNGLFAFNLAPWTPAAALLATSLGWLSATRVRAWMHWLVLGLLLAGTLASWWVAPIWAEPVWLEGLLPFQVFGFRFG